VPPVEPAPAVPDTVGAAIDRAVATLESLALLGEEVEDEWQYVQDLADTWQSRLALVARARASEALPDERGSAVVRACIEAGLIGDPHRAIDWLSTFPQVVLSALGERP
jgi:hypothetical protein